MLIEPVDALDAVNPPGPDQEYEVPPDAVNVVEALGQMVLAPEILHEGSEFTVSVLEQALEQPLASVTVTE